MVNGRFSRLLEDSGIPDADFEITCMLEQVTGMRYLQTLTPEQEQTVLSMIQRRIKGEPLQYILGEWEFYGMKIFIGEGVLIPRPDTELLVDTVLNLFRNKSGLKILDLCTGSGCIALALKRHLPDAHVSGIDISETALSYARKNAGYHHLDMHFHHADVLNPASAEQFRDYDIIISNPPYLTASEMADLQSEVRHEPALALYGGTDGMNFYQHITSIWKTALQSGGLLAYEIGWKQARSVREVLASNHFHDIHIIQDLEHRDRVVTGIKNF